jgi:hypothetical protein
MSNIHTILCDNGNAATVSAFAMHSSYAKAMADKTADRRNDQKPLEM